MLIPALFTRTSIPPPGVQHLADRAGGGTCLGEVGSYHLGGGRTARQSFAADFVGLVAVEVADGDPGALGGEAVHDAASDVGGARRSPRPERR